MLYEDYEDTIIERIKMQGVNVSDLPYIDALNDSRPTSKPRVFVMYNGSVFADPENLSTVAQKETLNFEAFIKAKNRRGKSGVLAVSEEIKARMLGYKPPGAITPITLSSFGYVDGIQNNWQYMLVFSFERYAVQQNFDELTVTIKEINTRLNKKTDEKI